MDQDAHADIAQGQLGLRLAANTAVQALGTLVSAVIGLATFLALTRGLGAGSFGDYTAAMAFLSFPIVIADVGLTVGVLREISAAPERTERTMGAFLPLSALVSTVTVTGLTVLGLLLPFSEQTKVGIAIGSVGALLSLMTYSLAPVLQARLKMHWAVTATVIGRLVGLGLILAAFAAGLGFKSVMAAAVIGTGVTFLVHLVAVARLVPLRLRVDVGYWRSLASSSVLLGVSHALGQINFRVDTVLLALFRSSAEVGQYGAAYKFIELSSTASNAVGVSVFPPLSRFAATGDARLHSLAQRSFDVLLAAAGPVMILALVFPAELLGWTAGEEYEPGSAALQLLALYIPFGFVNHLGWRLLAVFRRDRLLVAMTGSALTLAVVLCVFLIPPYGMKAAALITFSVEALFATAMALALVRGHGVRPRLGYAGIIVFAFGTATAIGLALPGPVFVSAAAALAWYILVLAAAPGTIRELLAHLLSAVRRPAGPRVDGSGRSHDDDVE